MYLIVVGAGAIGSQVLELVTGGTDDVVVIEQDAERAQAASQAYDCLTLHADATHHEVLEEAGADRADAVLCTTESDATNLMVLMVAQQLGVDSLVSVVQEPKHLELFRRLGAHVLGNPQRLIAEHLVRAVQRPSIRDFMQLGGDAEIVELSVTERAPVAGKTLAEAGRDGLIPDDILVIALERDDEVATPRGETRIEAGDLMTIYLPHGVDESVLNALTGDDGG